MGFKYNLAIIYAQLDGQPYDTYKAVRAKYEEAYINTPHSGKHKTYAERMGIYKPRLRSPKAFRGLWSKILKELQAEYGYEMPTQRASRQRERIAELKARIKELTEQAEHAKKLD